MNAIIPSPPNGATFESVWATLQAMQKETEEFRRTIQENNAKADLRMQKLEKESAKALQGLGDIRRSIGALVEHLMTPDLRGKFRKMGYTFTRYMRDAVICDSARNRLAEMDMVMENGDYVLVIEVKTKLRVQDIADHAERMEVVRGYADDRNDNRKYLGAIAAPYIAEPMLAAIYKAGFYALTASEDSVDVPVPDGFKPKEW